MKLLHLTNNWHEEIAEAYGLELVTSNPDILIVRDPLDSRFDDIIDHLQENGNTEHLTFEEYLFLDKNPICKVLGIKKPQEIIPTLDKIKFKTLSYHVRWPENFTAMYPKTQTEPNPYFGIHTMNAKLAKFLNTKQKMFELKESRFDSNELDTALRADFQMQNSLDYALVQKLRELGEFGDYEK